jgi:hypothetical protein
MGWMMPLFVRYWLYADNLATLRGTEHDQKGLLHACFCENAWMIGWRCIYVSSSAACITTATG